jgi:peptide deformylase
MAVLEILEFPDRRLTRPAEPVAAIDHDLERLLDDMLETMYAAPGIGLAAPQVGIAQRAFVADLGGEGERQPLYVINPEIVWRSADTTTAEEGCLSLPQQYGEVSRASAIRLRHQDLSGETREIEADGLLARCLQHEVDHLNGVLFIDHLSALKRTLIVRRLSKTQRSRSRRSA